MSNIMSIDKGGPAGRKCISQPKTHRSENTHQERTDNTREKVTAPNDTSRSNRHRTRFQNTGPKSTSNKLTTKHQVLKNILAVHNIVDDRKKKKKNK